MDSNVGRPTYNDESSFKHKSLGKSHQIIPSNNLITLVNFIHLPKFTMVGQPYPYQVCQCLEHKVFPR
jgi:hypothetical protein